MKFTPEEMAYDPGPDETAKWVSVGRGPEAIFAKPARAATVSLEKDVAQIFKDSASVNNALRRLIQAVPSQLLRKRKSA